MAAVRTRSGCLSAELLHFFRPLSLASATRFTEGVVSMGLGAASRRVLFHRFVAAVAAPDTCYRFAQCVFDCH
jgi:hypothetical protein